MHKREVVEKILVDLVRELIDYLYNEFPMFTVELLVLKNGMDSQLYIDKNLVLTSIKEYIVPYTEQIENCDQDFFLNIDTGSFALAERIKTIWKREETSDTQKAKIWLYFRKILRACGKI